MRRRALELRGVESFNLGEALVHGGPLVDVAIPSAFSFDTITALSMESRQKLQRIQPETLGQASRISGVSPADIQILMVHLGR